MLLGLTTWVLNCNIYFATFIRLSSHRRSILLVFLFFLSFDTDYLLIPFEIPAVQISIWCSDIVVGIHWVLAGCSQRIYELVVRHYLACVSQPAIGYGTTATVDIAGERFTATGLMITAVSVFLWMLNCHFLLKLLSCHLITFLATCMSQYHRHVHFMYFYFFGTVQKNYLDVYRFDNWGTSTIPKFEVGQQVYSFTVGPPFMILLYKLLTLGQESSN